MNKDTIDINYQDFKLLLMSAIEYSLGRMTYMPEVCMQIFNKNRAFFTDYDLKQLINLIEAKVMAAEVAQKTVGMRYDHQIWKNFIKIAQDILENSVENKK